MSSLHFLYLCQKDKKKQPSKIKTYCSLYILIYLCLKRSIGLWKPRNPDQGLSHRDETGNPNSLSRIHEVKDSLLLISITVINKKGTWVRVSIRFHHGE